MAEAPNLEGLAEKNSTDVEHFFRGWHATPPEEEVVFDIYMTFRIRQQQEMAAEGVREEVE
jgi:hypothetical protein